MAFRTRSTLCVAAGAALAAIALVCFGAGDADPSSSIRALARARQIAERSARIGDIRPQSRYMCLKRCA